MNTDDRIIDWETKLPLHKINWDPSAHDKFQFDVIKRQASPMGSSIFSKWVTAKLELMAHELCAFINNQDTDNLKSVSQLHALLAVLVTRKREDDIHIDLAFVVDDNDYPEYTGLILPEQSVHEDVNLSTYRYKAGKISDTSSPALCGRYYTFDSEGKKYWVEDERLFIAHSLGIKINLTETDNGVTLWTDVQKLFEFSEAPNIGSALYNMIACAFNCKLEIEYDTEQTDLSFEALRKVPCNCTVTLSRQTLDSHPYQLMFRYRPVVSNHPEIYYTYIEGGDILSKEKLFYLLNKAWKNAHYYKDKDDKVRSYIVDSTLYMYPNKETRLD